MHTDKIPSIKIKSNPTKNSNRLSDEGILVGILLLVNEILIKFPFDTCQQHLLLIRKYNIKFACRKDFVQSFGSDWFLSEIWRGLNVIE